MRKARINTYAFRQTKIDSANLGALGSLAHHMADEGTFFCRLHRGRAELAEFTIDVDDQAEAKQVDVDLAREGKLDGVTRALSVGGYLMLYVSSGPGGYHLIVEQGREKRRRRVMDSRQLSEGDLFIATPLRPGMYEVTNARGKGRCSIVVTYPEVGRKPFRAPAPERVTVAEGAFKPARLKVAPTQGILFLIEAPKATVHLECTKPDDGPKEKRPTVTRWVNPRRAQGGGKAKGS